MKKIIASTLAAAGLFSSGLAQAAGADLAVKGQLQPGACSVLIGDGSAFDLGTLIGTHLSFGRATNFRTQQLPLTVTCSTPTRFGLHLADNRADSTIDWVGTDRAYGLGTSGGKKTGEYISWIDAATSNGQPITILNRADPSGPWSLESLVVWRSVPDYLVSFTTTGDDQPAAFDQVTAVLEGSVFINKSSELDLSQVIRIDGSATLELVYL